MKARYLLLLLLLSVLIIAPASAWLSGFQYERDMEITSTYPITLTSYQMKVIFWNTTGVSNGQNCYLNGSITQPTTWNDLRITTTTDAICDMWIQETNATAAIVWIEVPYIYTGTTRLRVYTDKPAATAVSDGDATFRFWGTFQVVPLNVDKWIGVGNYTQYTDGGGNTVVDIMTNATSGVSSITSIQQFSYAVGYEEVIRANMALYPGSYVGTYLTGSAYTIFGASQSINNTYIAETRNAGGSHVTTTNLGTGYTGWHIFKVKRDQAAASVLYTIDNVVVANHTTDVPTNALPLMFASTAQNGRVIVDYAFVKKYVSPEPTITAWGAPTVETAPNTQFEAQPRFGPVGTTVYFYDLTTGIHNNWLWDVNGDGVTDFTTQNCNYTYPAVGTYNVSLSTSNSNGTDIQFAEDYILITGSAPTTLPIGKVPVAIAAVMLVGCIILTLYFLADNERWYASIFAAIMAGILSLILGYDFLLVGIIETVGTTQVTYIDQPLGWFLVMLGVMIFLLVVAIVADQFIRRKQEREERI